MGNVFPCWLWWLFLLIIIIIVIIHWILFF